MTFLPRRGRVCSSSSRRKMVSGRRLRNHVGTTVEHPVSPATRAIRSRISDEGVQKTVSVCPYCAVGCSTLVYHRDGRIVDIEGNPDSPINAGTLCPKGSATFGLHVSPYRWTKVRYRRPYSGEWEDLSLDEAMDMIADRLKKTREETWEDEGLGGQEAQPLDGRSLHRRGHDRQRGELPHYQALPLFGLCTNYEPGADMTQLHGARSGHHVR